MLYQVEIQTDTLVNSYFHNAWNEYLLIIHMQRRLLEVATERINSYNYRSCQEYKVTYRSISGHPGNAQVVAPISVKLLNVTAVLIIEYLNKVMLTNQTPSASSRLFTTPLKLLLRYWDVLSSFILFSPLTMQQSGTRQIPINFSIT